MSESIDPHTEAMTSGRRWMPGEVPPESQRAAIHRLAAALRTTIEALMDTDAPAEELDALAETAEAFAQQLGGGKQGRALWGFAESSNSGNPDASFDNSPLVGLGNPVAPPLRLHVDGKTVVGTAIFGHQYEGPPGHVHGGIISAAFDEVLGMVQSLTGSPGMTGKLVVNYRSPTPLHREVRFHAVVDRIEGRKIYASATLHHGDVLCAEAEGLFISVDFARLRRIAEEDQQD